jgi:broad specificity phosphatase PhoE
LSTSYRALTAPSNSAKSFLASPSTMRTALPVSSNKNFLSTAIFHDPTPAPFGPEEHWRSLTFALSRLSTPLSQPFAREMELDEASETKDDYDKVLLLMNHGQAGINKKGQYNLTKQGVGSVLGLTRKTATYCTEGTQLVPELVVVAPTKPCMHTALLSFPQYSPHAATRRPVSWMCQSDLVEHAEECQLASEREVETYFPGMDLSGHYQPQNVATDSLSIESKVDLLQQSEKFLTFVKSRNEKVVVVCSHTTWLQAFCGFSLTCEPRSGSLESFRNAEMRAVGVRFGKQ